MPKLVQKCGYIKGGGGAGYLKYIATREGVEKLHGCGAPTENQQKLIADLLRDFPDADELLEYEDYQANPCVSTASAFITMTVDANAHSMREGDGYMKYIATRSRVERRGDHGLFGREREVSLDAAMAQAREHTGNEWTIIFSLRREDAARLGYDRAEQWRSLLLRHQGEIADAMKIPPDQLRWYAAFHDEGHHPHVHMMVWSADPRQGYLTKAGIKTIRSKITGDIFQGELQTLYQRKDVSYKEVTAAAQSALSKLIRQMETTFCDSPAIAEKMEELADVLGTVTGKKVYGYLKKPVKEKVDAIVDELAQLPQVAECYERWNVLRDELENYYKAKPRQRLPLSQQKEFRFIKNMVIREAESLRLGTVTFEDKGMDDKPEEQQADGGAEKQWAEEGSTGWSGHGTMYQMAAEYREAKAMLMDENAPIEGKQIALQTLERLWDQGFTVAAHQLGKVWRDGLLDGAKDEDKAELWFRKSADAGNDYSQYALGKLLQGQGRINEAIEWYEQADNQYAHYRLGKLYLTGEDVPKDVEKAVQDLTAAAESGNQYAQYALGKLYLMGKDMKQDREMAWEWFSQSAAQGNQYAQFFLDHFDQYRDPSALLCATRLLYHLSRVFRDNSVPPTNPAGIRIDSKRRREIMAKRIAMGHKPDDHEPRMTM